MRQPYLPSNLTHQRLRPSIALAAVAAVALLLNGFVGSHPVQAASWSDEADGPSHLPDWVQSQGKSTRLYTTGGTSLVVQDNLAQGTYLKVVGASARRLQVEVRDDPTTDPVQGWVNPEDVAPSPPGDGWLASVRPTALLRGAEETSLVAGLLAEGARLQRASDGDGGRTEVKVYSADYAVVLATGWVGSDDLGPARPPHVLAPLPTLASDSKPKPQSNPAAFVAAIGPAAVEGRERTGVPASITVAQAILESGWGTSSLATEANNYFGMKALGSLGTDGAVWLPTLEYDADQKPYTTLAPFKAYKSVADSIVDHNTLLADVPRYARVMEAADDPKEFADRLMAAGYSTDPAYASKLVYLMDRYDLYRFDPPPPEPEPTAEPEATTEPGPTEIPAGDEAADVTEVATLDADTADVSEAATVSAVDPTATPEPKRGKNR
jgi:flagellar protein FlgJ